MNTTVSKSFGLALLLAVGILAVMVALGTFSAPNAGASVKANPTPTATFVNADDETVTVPDTKDVSLIVTFEINDDIDGAPTASQADDDVMIAVPSNIAIKASGFDKDDIIVTQGGDPVGKVESALPDGDGSLTIVITKADQGDPNVRANELVTVTIPTLNLAAAAMSGNVTVWQTGQAEEAWPTAPVSIYNPDNALTDLSATLDKEEVEAKGVTLILKFSTAEDQDGDVTITLPDEEEYDVREDSTDRVSIIIVVVTGGSVDDNVTKTRADDSSGDTITLNNINGDTEYTVTVGTAENSDKGGFTNPDEPDTFTVKFAQGVIPADEATMFRVVKTPPVKLTTNTPTGGATTQVIVEVASGEMTAIGDQVTIDMKKFGLPGSIDADDVSLRGLSEAGLQEQIGTPDLVDISKSEVTLTVPDMDPADDKEVGLNARYRVVFTKDAGVTIPTAAGNYKVSWISPAGDEKESNPITVDTELSVSPVKGERDTEITLKGTAWADGATSIYWVDDGDDKFIKDVTAEDNSFETTITPPKGFEPGSNDIKVKDADGIKTEEISFELTGTMEVSPATVDKGGIVKVTLSDWEEGDVEQARIGGEDVDRVDKAGKAEDYPVDTRETNDDDQVVFYVKVGEDVRLGTKTVSLLDEDDKRIGSEEIEIGALSLSVTPDTAVAGQQVTVSGSGFARGSTISGEVQSKTAEFPADSDEVTSSGRITVTFTIPAGVTHGTRTIEITDDKSNVGQVSLTVPEPAITVSPESSKRGSRLTITGSGFPANENVTVKYAGDNQRSVRSDGTGSWNTELGVPSGADIGEDATVEAIATSGTEDYIGKATHSVPAQTIALGSDTASSGNTLDISGDGFPRYASVKVVFGSHDPVSLGVNTDDNGSFPATSVLVPGLDKGTIIVRVTVNGITATELLEIVDAPVVRTVEDAFGDLIDNGSLQTIWAYDFDTGGWNSYTTDPETAFANDLFEVDSGDILYINVTGQQDFSHQQGETLPDGWSLITLK